MIENETNLTNTMGLVEVFGTIYNFSLTHWEGLSTLLIALILGGRGIVWLIIDWRVRKTKNLNHVFHKFKTIQTSDGKDTCKYSQQDLDECLKIRAVKIFLWNHGALRHYKRTKRAKKRYEEVDKEIRKKLFPITKHHIETRLGFFVGWNCKGDMPPNFYYYDHWGGEDRNFWLIDAIISNCTFRVIPQETSMFLLQAISSKYSGPIAGSSDKGNIERLREEIEMLMRHDEVVKLVKKVNDAKEAWDKADKKFKKKFAKVVNNLRYKAGGLQI